VSSAHDGMSPRQRELGSVNAEFHTVWLAGQVDEVEDKLLGRMTDLAAALEANTKQVSENTTAQNETRQRFTWLALSISITILTTVLGAVLVSVVT
jgi:hypothetical protein